MKIQFSKKYMYTNLILGILWIALGLYFVFISSSDWWGYYLYLVVGILYFFRLFNPDLEELCGNQRR